MESGIRWWLKSCTSSLAVVTQVKRRVHKRPFFFSILDGKGLKRGFSYICLLHETFSSMEQKRVFQLEETQNHHPVLLLDQFKADLRVKHAVKDFVQISLKHEQVWVINQPSKKPVPVFVQPLSMEKLPTVQPKPSLVQLWAIATHPVTGLWQRREKRYLPLCFPSYTEKWAHPQNC